MECGLLGRKLGHSYSPQIHRYLGEYDYALFEKEPEELKDFFTNADFSAINVTIPYKKDALPYCAELSSVAKRMGSVNTIVKRADGTLIGHNTDYFGFLSMVQRSGLQVSGKKVLVLGSGGASVTVVAVLQDLGANVVIISRTGEDNYSNLHLHTDAYAIVNTTPVGMYPNVDDAPVDLEIFPRLEGVLDLIYNPARTRLLQQAQELGLIAENGLWMLVAQAKESAEWFTGNTYDDSIISLIHKKLSLQMENLILVGMPGCGKSTIGKILTQKTGKAFADADEKIVEIAGKSIPEIFAQGGEDVFRNIETEALAQLGKQSGLVIATGGGCVTRQENYTHLHQNGRIIWLQRDLDQLPTDGRPLSQSGKLEAMYQVRKPLYEAFSDVTIINDTTEEAAADAVLASLNWED